MSTGRWRIILRWLHLVLGVVILCYIYSPLSQFRIFQLLMKWIIIPVITLSGVWIWKFKEINKILKI